MKVMKEANFWVGNVPVYGNAMLSPMAGYSDVPYRAICRAYGSAMHYTEFVSVDALLSKQWNPSWDLLDTRPGEYPIVFQIFGNDAQTILAAAQRIEEWGPTIIDVNMGCSTRHVSGRGAGVGMMRQPELVRQTFRLLTSHLRVPVTAKMRLGWEGQINYVEIATIAADCGVALVALHGRTKEQKYTGRADWSAIATLKQKLTIPVIGNGDVTRPGDVWRMQAETGCDGVMIGRGAIGNPWIFAGKEKSDLHFSELTATITLHLNEMMAYYQDKGLPKFRKHLNRYLSDIPLLADLLKQLLIAPSPEAVLVLVAQAEERVRQESSGRVGDIVVMGDPAGEENDCD